MEQQRRRHCFMPPRSVQIQAAWKSRTVIDSSGSASGNIGQQLSALGLAAPPAFHYSAVVHNVLPQSVTAGAKLAHRSALDSGFASRLGELEISLQDLAGRADQREQSGHQWTVEFHVAQ